VAQAERKLGDSLGNWQAEQLEEIKRAKRRAVAELDEAVCDCCGRGTLEPASLEGVLRALCALQEREVEVVTGTRTPQAHIVAPATRQDMLTDIMAQIAATKRLPPADEDTVVEHLDNQKDAE
jgi:hypothetical protein